MLEASKRDFDASKCEFSRVRAYGALPAGGGASAPGKAPAGGVAPCRRWRRRKSGFDRRTWLRSLSWLSAPRVQRRRWRRRAPVRFAVDGEGPPEVGEAVAANRRSRGRRLRSRCTMAAWELRGSGGAPARGGGVGGEGQVLGGMEVMLVRWVRMRCK